MPKPMVRICFMVVLSLCSSAHAQFLDRSLVSPRMNTIKPFGYGLVEQVLASLPGRTGLAWCKASDNRASECLSVSGGLSCNGVVAVGALVSCNQDGKANVDETGFAEVDCHNNLSGDGGASGLLSSSDWCGWTSYMATRTLDTVYLYNDYVRIGINKRFGGTVFELYGTDKLDRVQQNPGGAMQLALYGDDLNYAPAGTPSGWFASNSSPNFQLPLAQGWDNKAYASQSDCKAAHPESDTTCRLEMAADNVSDDITNVGCAWDGQDAGGGFNPVMGVSYNCWYGDPTNFVDKSSSPAPNYFSVSKTAPYNYSKSSNVPGLTWTETAAVFGPFAQLTYDISGGSNLRTMSPDFQELPALFLHNGIGGLVYFYAGAYPYSGFNQPVTRVALAANTTGILGYPSRTLPYGAGYDIEMTEDWVSMCDTTGRICVTTASFTNDSKLVQVSNNTTGSYLGIHGFFNLQPGLSKRNTIFIAPYRFDDIVDGRSVREWIYALHSHPLPPPLD